MRIGILIIGDEILSGRRRDAHFAHTLEVLHRRELQLDWARLAGDDAELLTQQFRDIRLSGDLCFSFGGIGATPDDLTRQCVATAWDVPLARHVEAQAEIEAQFGEAAYPNRILMADLPQGAQIIPNPIVRIPGFSLDHVHCLPGFPRMAWPMLEWVLENRYAHLQRNKTVELALTIHGVHESELIDDMNALLARHPRVRLFSLPRFLDDGGRDIEFGVKGQPEAVRAAMDEMRVVLDGKGCRYSECTSGKV